MLLKKKKRKKEITPSKRKTLNGIIRAILIARDGEKCLKCGKTEPLHNSHIYPKGKYRRMEFITDNLKLLCCGCHLYWWHKHPLEAGEWLKTVVSKDRLKRLTELSRTNMGIKKRVVYEELKTELEEELQRLM